MFFEDKNSLFHEVKLKGFFFTLSYKIPNLWRDATWKFQSHESKLFNVGHHSQQKNRNVSLNSRKTVTILSPSLNPTIDNNDFF